MIKLDDEFMEISRNVFRAIRGPTLLDVRQAIENDEGLDAIQRRDMLSALSRIETHMDKALADNPATASALREVFAALNPVRMGISEKSFRNIRSAATAAVRRYGGAPRPITVRIPLTEEWRALLNKVEVRHVRFALNRLAAYCSHMRIPPEEVNQTTLAALYEALDAEEIVKNPRKLVKHIAMTWNRCRREINGWPPVRLESLFKKIPYSFPLEAFPQSFQDEVAAWRKRVEDPDVLDLDAPARPLRPETVMAHIMGIRRFASALVHRGDLKIGDIVSLRTLMEPERFKSALRFFMERLGGKPTASLHNLANTMRHIARHWCKLEDGILKELPTLCARLEPERRDHLSPKKRGRLQQFDHPENVKRFLFFPEDQVAKAKAEKNPKKASKRVERALMVALLINCGLRQRTLRMLELDDFRST